MPKPLILIADDQEVCRKLFERTLAHAGFEPVCAKDGREALEMADRLRPPLAVLDALMPGLHGFEVCRQMKQIDPTYRPKVMILTAVYRSTRHINEAWRDFGVDLYLTKPAIPASVVQLMRAAKDWMQLHDPVQLLRASDPSASGVDVCRPRAEVA